MSLRSPHAPRSGAGAFSCQRSGASRMQLQLLGPCPSPQHVLEQAITRVFAITPGHSDPALSPLPSSFRCQVPPLSIFTLRADMRLTPFTPVAFASLGFVGAVPLYTTPSPPAATPEVLANGSSYVSGGITPTLQWQSSGVLIGGGCGRIAAIQVSKRHCKLRKDNSDAPHADPIVDMWRSFFGHFPRIATAFISTL